MKRRHKMYLVVSYRLYIYKKSLLNIIYNEKQGSTLKLLKLYQSYKSYYNEILSNEVLLRSDFFLSTDLA